MNTLYSWIKEKVSILDVVQEYIQLKKAGHYWKGLSPFKQERTPSFTVSPHKGIYYCFSTNKGGDVIDFIAQMENCSQHEAADQLIERYQLSVPPHLQSHTKNSKQHERYYDVCEIVSRWCQEQLTQSPAAQDYLKKRRITNETIKHFSIGYFPTGNQSIKKLLNYAFHSGLNTKDLKEAHVIQERSHQWHSSFEGRIIFPILDHLGRYCGFGGRVFKKDDARPKYYNSPDHPCFSKGTLLYGLDKAKRAIQERDEVFLVEGYTDCIAMTQAGYPHVVATLGTACRQEHLTLLARYSQTIYVMYDGDSAGKQAMLRLARLCWQTNARLAIILLNAGEDPASLVTQTGTLPHFKEHARDIFMFYIQTMGEDFFNKPIHQRLQAVHELIKSICSLHDTLKRDMLLHHAAQAFEIPFETIRATINTPQSKNTNNTPAPAASSPQHLENLIICGILSNETHIREEEISLLRTLLPDAHKELLSYAYEEKKKEKFDFQRLCDTIPEKNKQLLQKLTLSYQEHISQEAFDGWLKEFYKKQWKITINHVKLELKKGITKSAAHERYNELKRIVADRGLI